MKHYTFTRNTFYNKKQLLGLLTSLLLLFTTITKAQDKLVGLTTNGGPEGAGTAFSINTNGGGFSIINGFVNWGSRPTNDLVKGSDGNLYGVITEGGTYNNGTIYKITPTGTITILKNLNMAVDGGYPRGSLIQATDGNFYGLASTGSINNGGCIFKITPGGTYSVVRSLSINTDGGRPRGHLIQAKDGNFYGMNTSGGTFGYGTIFKLTPDGTYTVLKAFNTADGTGPYGSLVQASDGNFYGMTNLNGAFKRGTIFRITPGGTYTVLHDFNPNGVDGEYPLGDLIQAKDGLLYGMTPNGGANFTGTIFKMNMAGTSYTVIRGVSASVEGGNPQGSLIQASDGNFYGTAYNISGGFGGSVFKLTQNGTTSVIKKFILDTEGGYPSASLIQNPSDGQLYGTNNSGGKDGDGTIFKLTTAGAITVLTHLNGSNRGSMPQDNLVLGKDSAYYGVTTYGGTYNFGTIFKICGGVTTILHSFNNNLEGGNPSGGLVRGADGNLYGCTEVGGSNQSGTIYKITPAGNFTVLRHLKSATDGSGPHSSMVLGKDSALYGVTNTGGPGTGGTIFRITTAGVFTVLHSFVPSSDGGSSESGLVLAKDGLFYGITGNSPRFYKITKDGAFSVIRSFTYAEGTNPYGSLIQATDGNFYGTFNGGGLNGYGVVFRIKPDGTYTKLRDLSATTDGSSPKAGLVQAPDGNFYGTTSTGGTNKVGTIFKVTLVGGTFSVLRHMDMAKDGGASYSGLIVAPTNNLVANGQSVTTTEDVAKAITLTGSTGSNVTYTIVTAPKKGKVSTGTTANRTYTPNANANGKDSFAFTTNIGCLASAPAWVIINITPVNDAPVLAAIGNKSVVVNTTLTFTATATDVDAGQTKTFSLISAPSGATINATTGVFTWKPTTTGSYTFKVRVTDNGSPVLYDEEQITVTVSASLTASADARMITAVPSTSNEKSSIYPNPVTNRFTVDIKKPGNCTIQIVDIKGTLLSNRKYTRDNSPLQIEATQLTAGQYYLRVQYEDGTTEVLKFIKM